MFGGREEAARAGAELRALHRGIKGVDADGNRYHALAPEPFAWVHATLVDSFIETVERFQRTLGAAEREQIYQEMNQLGRLYGVREMPGSWEEFAVYRDRMVAERLVVTPTLLGVLDSILHLPRPPSIPIPAGAWRLGSWTPSQLSRLITVGMLPLLFRERLELSWTAANERALQIVQAAIRATFPRLPLRLQLIPPAYRMIGGCPTASTSPTRTRPTS
jgi:uncharacterized protein (DUF2236 family)